MTNPAGPAILMVSAEYPPTLGGVGDYAHRLCRQLRLDGVGVTVLAGPGPAPAEDCGGAIPVVRRGGSWGFRSWPEIADRARKVGASIIHLQYQAAAYAMHPAINLLPLYLRSALPRARMAVTFHDLRVPYLFPKAGPMRPWAIRALDRWSRATVVTNQADMEKLGGPAGGRRWLIPIGSNIDPSPPAGFDRSRWRSSRGIGPDTLLLSYFGFMNASKGLETLIDGMDSLVGRGLDLRLQIVGGETGPSDPTNSSYSQRIAHRIRQKGMVERVDWEGFASPEQVSAALMSADLCVLPFQDGASLRRGSLLAALAHGVPLVTTYPSQPEPLLEDGKNVALVPAGDPERLADVVLGLWRDAAARARIGEGARSLSGSFSWEEIAGRHRELYRSLA